MSALGSAKHCQPLIQSMPGSQSSRY